MTRSLAPVRQRPWMYVGNCQDGSGLLVMLLELVASAGRSSPGGSLHPGRPPGRRRRHHHRRGRWAEDLSSLLSGLRLTGRIGGDELAAAAQPSAGLVGRVALAVPCPGEQVAHERGTVDTEAGPIDVDVALAWRSDPERAGDAAAIESFANLNRTLQAGSHVDVLLDGIRAFIGGRHRTRHTTGLVAAVSVVLPDVKFGRPTRDPLINPEARPAVRAATLAALTGWATRHPEAASRIRTRAT